MVDTRAVRAACLRRDQILLIASGRSTEQNLTVLRRHLAECGRCRAAVAARAGGVRGPGDTVLLKREKARLPNGIKIIAVAISLLVVIGAWRYAGAPSAATLAAPAATEPASGEPSSQGQQVGAVETKADPEESFRGQLDAVEPPNSGARPSVTPIVSPAGLYDVEAGERVAAPPPKAARRRRSARAGRAARTRAESSITPATSADEFDFGIDEPAPQPGRGGGRSEPSK